MIRFTLFLLYSVTCQSVLIFEMAVLETDAINWVSEARNDSGVRLPEAHPEAYTALQQSLGRVFVDFGYDILYVLSEEVFFELLGPVNTSYGSAFYHNTYQYFIDGYLHAGFFKVEVVEGARKRSGVTINDDLFDSIYDEFHIEDSFHDLFPVFYQGVRDVLFTNAKRLHNETDLYGLTTDYMRYGQNVPNNLVFRSFH